MQTPVKRRKHLLLSFFSLLTTTHGCFLGYTVPHPDIHFPFPLTPSAQAPAIPTHGSAHSSNFWTFLESEVLGVDFLFDSLDLHLLAMLAGSTSPQWPLHEIQRFFLVLFLMQTKNLTMGNLAKCKKNSHSSTWYSKEEVRDFFACKTLTFLKHFSQQIF